MSKLSDSSNNFKTEDKRCCLVCGDIYELHVNEWIYEVLGVCCSCAQDISNAYTLCHTDSPLLDPDGKWDAHPWAVARRKELAEPAYKKTEIPEKLRWTIWNRDGFACVRCGHTHRLTVDHIHPEKHGGSLDPANLQTLCKSCNSAKGARILAEVSL